MIRKGKSRTELDGANDVNSTNLQSTYTTTTTEE